MCLKYATSQYFEYIWEKCNFFFKSIFHYAGKTVSKKLCQNWTKSFAFATLYLLQLFFFARGKSV